MWMVERTRRGTVWDLRVGNGISSGTEDRLSNMGEMLAATVKQGERLTYWVPNEPGSYWLTWIDRGGRKYTRGVLIDAEAKELVVTGVKPKNGMFQT
jgi:hypothetical protein